MKKIMCRIVGITIYDISTWLFALRDIKPENLLLTANGDEKHVKLADFGLAKEVKGEDPEYHDWAGTPCYISPEILLHRPYSKPVDIWSCGVILYVILVGFPPFWDDNPQVLQSMITNASYDFSDSQWNDVTDSAKALIDRMLEFDPRNRITAKQALRQNWIAKRETVTSKLHRQQTIIDLIEFSKARRKWKVIGHTVMMSNRFKMLLKEGQGMNTSATELNPIQELFEEDGSPTNHKKPMAISPKTSQINKLQPLQTDNLRHYESDFTVDIIAITERISEAMVYRNNELYQELSDPDCTTYSPQLETREYRQPRVSITNPIVHMIGTNGACIFYTKIIAYLGSDSKYAAVEIPETRVWKNFDWKWKCVHFHTS